MWKNSYIRSRFKACEGLVCIVHQAVDGSWGLKPGSVDSSGRTLCLPMPSGIGVIMECNPLCFLTITALRKGPVDTQGNPMVFSVQFLLHMVGSGLNIPGLVLNEAPAYWGLGAWEEGKDGKMIPKLYTKPHDCSHR